MRRPRIGLAGIAIATAIVGAATLPRLSAVQEFPHAEHAGLFPVCVGCHTGIEQNDSAR